MRYAETLTGKKVELVPDESTSTMASIRLARDNDEAHVVRYQPQLEQELPYLVAHECGHLIRMYEAPHEHQKLPMVTAENRRRAAYDMQRDLEKLNKRGIPDVVLGQMLAMWHQGLIRQVTNLPVDMRIESWLSNGYPSLRNVQRRGIEQQLTEAREVLNRRVKELTPQKVYEGSVSMNGAYALYMSLLLGDANVLAPYRNTRYERAARELALPIWRNEDRGYVGDVEEAERWARRFGIRDWFGWVKLQT